MSAVQGAPSSRRASSNGDNGLCESDPPSSASMATCEGLTDGKEMISRLLEAARTQRAEELRTERRRADKACKGLSRKKRILTARMQQRQQDDRIRFEAAETKVAEQSARIVLLERRLAARDDENAVLRNRVETLLTAVKETGDKESATMRRQGDAEQGRPVQCVGQSNQRSNVGKFTSALYIFFLVVKVFRFEFQRAAPRFVT